MKARYTSKPAGAANLLASILLLLALTAGLTLSGCASPPNRAEARLFDIQTNYVPVVELRTNTVWQTNQVAETVTRTNTIGVTIPVTVTNYVAVPLPVVTTITNVIPVYDYQRGTNAAAVQQTAAGIGNLVAPGVGGPIASAVVGLILAGWGWIRSSRATATAANSAQVIETARELLKTLPNGGTYDAQLVTWMQQHQAEQGVLNDVLKLLERNVSNDSAQAVARQIADAVAALKRQ